MLLLVVLTGVLRRRWLATAAFYGICVALMGSIRLRAVGTRSGAARDAGRHTFRDSGGGRIHAVFFLVIWFPLTLDPNAFYITSSVIVTVLVLGLAWCALYTTLGGKPLGGWTESPSL